MTAGTLLSDLRDRGFRLTTADGLLHVSPARNLTEQDRDAIRTHKREMIRLLTNSRQFDVGAEAWLVNGHGERLDRLVIFGMREMNGETWYHTAGRELAWTNAANLQPFLDESPSEEK